MGIRQIDFLYDKILLKSIFKVLVNDSYISIYSLKNILEPDVGMPQQDANRYFKQLINGVVSIIVAVWK